MGKFEVIVLKGLINLQLDQSKTPLFEAVKKYVNDGVVPLHVPGHKQGAGIKELKGYVGEEVLKIDLSAMEELDFANNPGGAILESEALLADAYGAERAFFLVNGTTSGVQAMILSTCNPGDKILIPRNAHKSTVGGLILSGAVPVYIQPEFSSDLGIAMGVSNDAVKKAIEQNPDAKAVFIINPTYYGMASDIKTITRLAHEKGISVLADEAHGAHFHFNEAFPLSAMDAGADMSAASIHKTGGSLTQSSALLIKKQRDVEKAKQALNLTASSSASYILMSSLDIARKQLALNGREMLGKALNLSAWARSEINSIEGLYTFGKELEGTSGCFAIDETKIGVSLCALGLTGYEAEARLRNEYKVQIEMSDLGNILALITIGDSMESVRALVEGLKSLAKKPGTKKDICRSVIWLEPEVLVAPREAFYRDKKALRLEDSAGEIAGEIILAYPPGIPVIGIGERITKDIIEYIKILKKERCQLQGTSDPKADFIRVLK